MILYLLVIGGDMEQRLVCFRVDCGPTMQAAKVLDCYGLTDEEIDTMAWELSVNNAEMYGDFIVEDDEYLDSDDQGRYFTDSDLGYTWEDYDPEKHDMYRAGGGSFMDDVSR